MPLMTNVYTVRDILEEGGELPMRNAPYGKWIYFYSPSREVSDSLTCRENLAILEKYPKYLALSIEQVINHRQKDVKFILSLWSFGVTILTSLAWIGIVIYIAFISKTIPSWEDAALPFILIGMISWKFMGLTSKESVGGITSIVSAIMPKRVRRMFGEDEPIRQDYQDRYSDDNRRDNGNSRRGSSLDDSNPYS